MAEQNQKNNRRALITSLVNRLGVSGYGLEDQFRAMDDDRFDEWFAPRIWTAMISPKY